MFHSGEYELLIFVPSPKIIKVYKTKATKVNIQHCSCSKKGDRTDMQQHRFLLSKRTFVVIHGPFNTMMANDKPSHLLTEVAVL